MARWNFKETQSGNMVPLTVKVEDTLPVGTEVDYDGSTIPEGWEEVDEIYGIVDSGSNANGNYIKYGDGTMICHKKINRTVTSVSAWGSLYEANVDGGSWAISFISVPTVSVVFSDGSGFIEKAVPSTTGITPITVARPTSTTSWGFTLDITAIGRWK